MLCLFTKSGGLCSAEPAYDPGQYRPVPYVDTSCVAVLGNVDTQSAGSVSCTLCHLFLLKFLKFLLLLLLSLIFTVMDCGAERLNRLTEITLSIPSPSGETRPHCRQVSLYPHNSQNCLSRLFLKISSDGGSHHTQTICQGKMFVSVEAAPFSLCPLLLFSVQEHDYSHSVFITC